MNDKNTHNNKKKKKKKNEIYKDKRKDEIDQKGQ